jgi:hypothetical protein
VGTRIEAGVAYVIPDKALSALLRLEKEMHTLNAWILRYTIEHCGRVAAFLLRTCIQKARFQISMPRTVVLMSFVIFLSL